MIWTAAVETSLREIVNEKRKLHKSITYDSVCVYKT